MGAIISFINKNQAATAAGTGVTLSKPTDTAENDVMIAVIGVEQNDDLINSEPSGWTRIINYTPGTRPIHLSVYYKKAGASEPSSYAWGISQTDEIFGIIATYRGVKVDPAVGIGNYSNSTSTSSGEPTAPTINVQTANNAVLFGCINAYGTTYLPPSGFVEREDIRTGTGSTNISGCLADDLETAAGETGNIAGDASATDYFVAFALELVAARVEGPSGVASAEAFGTAKLIGTVLAAGAIASALAFGDPSVATAAQVISALNEGIATAETFGDEKVTGIVLSAGGIASAEAFGTGKITGILQPSGLTSEEAIGTEKVVGLIKPDGIATGEALGSVELDGLLDVSAITSEESFGDFKVLHSPLWLCGNISSAEAFGTPALVGTILASDVSSAEDFGSHSVLASGAAKIYPSAIDSEEAFGTAQIGNKIQCFTPITSEEAIGSAKFLGIISPSGISSAEAFGTADTHVKRLCGGILSEEAFGSATVSSAAATQIRDAGAISTEEAFGDAIVRQFLISGISGIGTEEAFGTASLSYKKKCGAIASQEAFGSASVVALSYTTIILNGLGIAGAEAFGTANIWGFPAPQGIASAEAIGIHWVFEYNWCGNIASEEAFGSPVISGAAASTIKDISGISSAEAFGSARIRGRISTSVIATGYESGNARLVAVEKPAGISSGEAFGTQKVIGVIKPSGISSEESFGDTYIVPVISDAITGTGRIYSVEAFGTAKLRGTIVPSGIVSSEQVGDHTVKIAPVVPSGIVSAESFGAAKLKGTILASGIASAEVVTYTALVWNMVWLDELVLELESGLLTEIELYSKIDDGIELFSKYGGK